MTRPRDEKGRFVRANGEPVLHRQVWTDDGKASATVRVYTPDGKPLPLDGWDFHLTSTEFDDPEWLHRQVPQPIDHGPRIELRTLVLAALFLAIVAAAFMGLAWLSGGGAGQ